LLDSLLQEISSLEIQGRKKTVLTYSDVEDGKVGMGSEMGLVVVGGGGGECGTE